MRVYEDQFLELVKEEVIRAREKFPTTEKLLVALQEEAGEVAKSFLDYGQFSHQALEELVQVAAVALRLANEGDTDFDNWKGLKTR